MPTRPANQSLNRSVWLRGIGGFFALIFFLAAPCWAQLPQAGDTTSPPTPGVGHDYIHSPVETVNPANGSVSIRVPIRIPEGRELTIPLSIAYDSSGSFYIGEAGLGGQPGLLPKPSTTHFFSQGGWSYTLPLLSESTESWTVQSPDGKNLPCVERINYVFQDPTGNRHNMGLATIQNSSWVQYCGGTSQDILQGSEGPLLFTTPGYSNGATATDGNGTVYSFPSGPSTSITDRNGNTISISYNPSTPSATITDTAGRTAVNLPTFGSNPDNITVAGLSSPYQVSWTTASPNFTDDMLDLDAGKQGDGGCPTSMSGSANVVSQIVLPNGQKYTFTYDPTYGMLTKIVYPSGGYVRYVWGLNHDAEALSWVVPDPTGFGVSYDCRYGFPAITDRYVSFDGSTEVLHQQFSYSTSWPSGSDQYTTKTTQVTTTVTNPDQTTETSTTVYTYSPVGAPDVPELNPNVNPPLLTVQIPVEQCIEYYNVSGTGGTPPATCQNPNPPPAGKLLKTVVKSWNNNDPRTLGSEQTTLDNGQSSLKVYCYSANEQVTETDEYDYGTATATLPSCSKNVPSGTAAGSLLRKTVTNYATFTGAHIVDLPSSVITCSGTGSDAACNNSGTRVAETDSSYDQSTPQAQSPLPVQHVAAPGGSARGNLTTVTKQCFNGPCGGGNPTTTYSYYDTGQINQMVDPCGNGTCSDMPSGVSHTTTFSYTDSYSSCGGNAPPSGATNAYLTQVTYPPTNGVNHVESHCYDYSAGLLKGSTDENNQTTTYAYESLLDRLSQANYPDTGQTTVSYYDTPPTPSVTVNKKLNTAGQLVTTQTNTNGMGLATLSQLRSDPQGIDNTATSYDGLGRAFYVYNPYRSGGDPTYAFTTYAYDALNRTISVTKPDGGVVSTAYSGNCTTVTDEAGKNRESCTDGLGRMTQVIENPGGLGYVTNYTYDTLNNLLTVVQGGSRNRSFTYDSLKRLLTSQNPESGTVTYTYDANGNVATKTDARSITTTNSYDALNRVTGVTYSNSDPSVSYTYDQATCIGQSPCFNIGHRTTMTDAGGSENLAYDKMGRELVEQRTTNAVTKTTTYAYNLLGDITALTYPSGRTITYTYDSAGRPSDAVDTANSINYVVGSCANGASSPSTGACYAPMGAVSQMQNGTNLVSTYIYNDRLQPCWFYATTGAALATSTLCTGSATAGNILDLKYNFNLGAGDNGNVFGITNNRDSTRTQSFTYDNLNRIATGKTSSTSGSNCWGENYTIDQWGNLTAIGAVSGYTGCTQESLSVSATTKNQLSATGYSYDASGNMLKDAANTYAYNAESEIKSAANTCYTYDGDGNRLEKRILSGGQCLGVTKSYWYGAGTEILDEMTNDGTFSNEYVFFGGKRVAMRNVFSGVIYYYAEDMLGSSRTIVQAGQTAPCYDGDFYPFGGERIITNTCAQNYKFEGKERDTESGNDDFGARYYSSRLGRWLSADWSSVPVPVPYANLSNPQTLNLYAMVSDNPETFADLDGHDACPPTLTGTYQTCKVNTSTPPAAAGSATQGDGFQTPATPTSTTQQAQAQNQNPLQTISNGIGAAITNTLIDTFNLGNEIAAKVSGAPAPTEVPEIKPGTPGEKAVSDVANLGMFLLPESKAADLEKVGVVLREEKIAKAGEQVAEYSESALKSSARKASAQIEKHLNILKSATERQIRSIKVDLRHNAERLEAIIREFASRGPQ